MIHATFPYEKKRLAFLGLEMSYIDEGQGDPIVFLHGNPASSYLWRNIMPHVQQFGRLIAPDLIGMGDSQKLPDSGPNAYTYVEHRRYLDALLAQLDVKARVTFVLHDWGSALGFDWACRHPDAVRGIAYMEAIVRERAWSEMTETARKVFQVYRSSAGEQMVLQENRFIEFNLPNTILRQLSEEELAHYRRPFAEPGEGRRPMLSWARQLPIEGEPVDVTAVVTTYGAWLAQSNVPKLFVHSEPGTMSPNELAFCRSWPAQREITVPARHYPQEDAPDALGQALADWMSMLP